MAAGLVGALFYAAFGPFQCPKCGKIPWGEFPSEVRLKAAMISVLLAVIAIGIGVLVFWLMANTE